MGSIHRVLGFAAYAKDLEAGIKAVDGKVITWRRDFHQNPELSNREVRTSGIVAEHLKKLGLEVETGIAKTGVVACSDRQTGSDHRASRRHGRAAGRRAHRRAVQVDGEV